jgi:hypothetical protein
VSRRLATVFFLFFFLSQHALLAQTEKEEQVPLAQIIHELETRYGRKFSYADKTINGIKANMPPKDITLEKALRLLETETGLSFDLLGKNFVVVYSPTDEGPIPFPAQTLETVVITNYLTKGISVKRDGAVEIDYADFGILPGLIEPDVLLTLQALPGVESVDETVSNINVRGGTHDQNLILWDGIKMYQSGHFFGLISAFNPYQTKKAYLIKNGTDPAYGNSVSSVISMKTGRKINDKFNAEAGINYVHVGAFADAPTGKNGSVQVSARTSINNLLITPTYEKYFSRAFQGTEITENISTNERFSFSDLSLRWLYDISGKDRIRLNFIGISNELGFDENALIENEFQSKKSELTQRSLGGGLFYEREWNKSWTTSAQLYVSNYKLEALNNNLFEQQQVVQENEVIETSLKAVSNKKLNELFDWDAGYQFTETGISNLQDVNNPDFRAFTKEVERSHAVFSALGYVSENTSTVFEVGARLNYFKNLDQFRVEPRFSFNQAFSNDFNIEVLGEMKSQVATQTIDYQTDFLGVEKRRWRLADGDEIPLLRSKQISLGAVYDKNDWLVSVTGYLKEVEGISSQSQGFQNQYQFARFTGSFFTKGIDFLIDKSFGNFSSYISYSLSGNEYTFPILPEENFPNAVEIVNSVSFATSYEINDFKVSAGLKYRNGKPFTPLTPTGLQNDQLIYEAPNSDNLEDYFRVDISASQKLDFGKGIKALIGVSIWNLLDTENIIDSHYRLENGDVVRVFQKGLGLTPNLSVRVFF